MELLFHYDEVSKEMTAKKFCRYGDCGPFETLLFDPYEQHVDLCIELCLSGWPAGPLAWQNL